MPKSFDLFLLYIKELKTSSFYFTMLFISIEILNWIFLPPSPQHPSFLMLFFFFFRFYFSHVSSSFLFFSAFSFVSYFSSSFLFPGFTVFSYFSHVSSSFLFFSAFSFVSYFSSSLLFPFLGFTVFS